MSGRVLTASAIVDIATDRSVYGRAFLVAAVELGMVFPTPSTALVQAWAAIPTADPDPLRAINPDVEVEELPSP